MTLSLLIFYFLPFIPFLGLKRFGFSGFVKSYSYIQLFFGVIVSFFFGLSQSGVDRQVFLALIRNPNNLPSWSVAPDQTLASVLHSLHVYLGFSPVVIMCIINILIFLLFFSASCYCTPSPFLSLLYFYCVNFIAFMGRIEEGISCGLIFCSYLFLTRNKRLSPSLVFLLLLISIPSILVQKSTIVIIVPVALLTIYLSTFSFFRLFYLQKLAYSLIAFLAACLTFVLVVTTMKELILNKLVDYSSPNRLADFMSDGPTYLRSSIVIIAASSMIFNRPKFQPNVIHFIIGSLGILTLFLAQYKILVVRGMLPLSIFMPVFLPQLFASYKPPFSGLIMFSSVTLLLLYYYYSIISTIPKFYSGGLI